RRLLRRLRGGGVGLLGFGHRGAPFTQSPACDSHLCELYARPGSLLGRGQALAGSVWAVTDAPWRRAARGALLLDADGVARPTIFAEMSALATATGAINLGQGFPDEDGPAEVLDAAREAI